MMHLSLKYFMLPFFFGFFKILDDMSLDDFSFSDLKFCANKSS